MLERYVIYTSGEQESKIIDTQDDGKPYNYEDVKVIVALLNTQQATIADLQGQLATAKAPRVYDCGSCAIGKGFEQRVAQLEGGLETQRTATYQAVEREHAAKKQLITLQADHATLLGLVQALMETWVNGRKVCDGIPLTLRQQLEASLPAQPAQGE